MSRQIKLLTATIAGLLASAPAYATNGYAMHGIGMHAKGMGGASIAFPQDGVSFGQNPAALAVIGNRLDVGIDIFRPIRDAEICGECALANPPAVPNFVPYDGSESEWFFIPEFAFSRAIDDQLSVGVSVFGNGGLNTDYGNGIPLFNTPIVGFMPPAQPNQPPTPIYQPLSGDTGINLQQAFIVPTLSFKINDQHSIGIGLNLVAQGFKAWGINTFGSTYPNIPAAFGPLAGAGLFSTSPPNVSDNGTDWSFGWGVRVGWLGQINDMVSLGAYYSSKTWMQEFEEYEGLFRDGGAFDIPENYGIGIAIKATPDLVIAADITQINYSEVESIGEGISSFYGCPVFAMQMGSMGNPNACLGGSNGPGFGWQDQTVFKLGVQYRVNEEWTVRAGWNYAEQPIPQSETMFNVLAPGVVEHHLTLGASWSLDKTQELTFAYMHAFENEVEGLPTPGLGRANIKMYQDSFGIQYSWKM
jgi:long-chain fatty acid transport protein